MGYATKNRSGLSKRYTIHWGIAHPVTDEIMGSLGYYRGFENGVGRLAVCCGRNIVVKAL
ncbi:MAG: hypothetical protein IPF67_10995 [Saprospiraceae bacterium]|nr:hypothetical protein [Candidatus Brachybacter algidus]